MNKWTLLYLEADNSSPYMSLFINTVNGDLNKHYFNRCIVSNSMLSLIKKHKYE